nr:hypothetical protein [uncultured Desulfobulbus sp.]
MNRHALGQVSCQECHIREFAKGGATEMTKDWKNRYGIQRSVQVKVDLSAKK